MSALARPNGHTRDHAATHHHAVEALADAVTPRVAGRLGDQVSDLTAEVTRLREQVATLSALADRLLDQLGAHDTPDELVDANTLASILSIDPRWIRQHADELGARRLGNGPRPRLRFDVMAAKAAMARRERAA